MPFTAVEGVEVRGPRLERSDEILTPDALALVAELERELRDERAACLARR